MTDISMTYTPGSDGPYVYRCCNQVIFKEPQATYHLWRIHELPFLAAWEYADALSLGRNGLAQGAPPPVLPQRCVVCDWPLAASPEKGCVLENCAYRPAQGTPEHARIVALQLEAVKAADKTGPTVLDAFLVQCEYAHWPCPVLDARNLLNTLHIPYDAPASHWGAAVQEAVQRWVGGATP